MLVHLSRLMAANLRMKYHPLSFGGQILYSRTSAEVEKAAVELLQFLEVKKKETGQVAIGFDIEWRPSFRRGIISSLFQLLFCLILCSICANSCIHVFL